ncbi:Dps family protein [Brevibacillus massiliensis]|jgi:starvation-inducible DNA-binding protein|uniref:Dps family protein n=1 Tax=Brevibacillus massiliensis TaxID=1118054 RepID=UPI0002D850BF|nr:Dps family protein [Brevibacillus massiliensis]
MATDVSQVAKSVTSVLNTQIANWGVLYVKLHNYHWYVSGPNFYTLHATFEQLYNEAAQYLDELAERLLALKQKPLATMREYLEKASIKEATGSESTESMVKTIADDFDTLIAETKEGLKIAESQQDDATADMLTSIRQSLEKHVWMLRSFLK